MNETPPTPRNRSLSGADSWSWLRACTAARIALGRAGASTPTESMLDFQLAHARARDAVHAAFDAEHLKSEISNIKFSESSPAPAPLILISAANTREEFLLRPDLGRRLDAHSRDCLQQHASRTCDLALIVSDGLSALAIHRQTVPLLRELLPLLHDWTLSPITIVQRGRVAIQDEIGELLRASIAVILIGERPGLGAPDSLGAYLVYGPKVGLTDAQRNCISNIRPEDLGYAQAAKTLHYLLTQSRHHRLSGVGLKDDSHLLA